MTQTPTAEREAAKRDSGARTATASLDPADAGVLRQTIRAAAIKYHGFTADDIHRDLPPGVADRLDAFPNAIGAAFLQAAKRHEIRNTGRYIKSDREGRRRGRIAVWEGVTR